MPSRADFRFNPQCKKFLSIGLPLALQEFLTQLSFLALCAFVNRLGLTASSGYGVASKIVNFAMLIPSVLMQSMASFVAQNVGAGNQKRAKQSMLTGIGVGLAFGCAVFALVMLKGDVLAGIFSPDAEVVQKGFEYLKGFAPETILTAIMWVIWNKTKFGKNMFAVGSNEEAARVSGVNVFMTILMVFVLAGVMYGITRFIEGARIASCSANTGLNYECDAIAACVIGGVSFVGGTGKISGIVIGVLLLQIIFAGLNFLSVSANMLYIIKGVIILVACAIDMRKYLARR